MEREGESITEADVAINKLLNRGETVIFFWEENTKRKQVFKRLSPNTSRMQQILTTLKARRGVPEVELEMR